MADLPNKTFLLFVLIILFLLIAAATDFDDYFSFSRIQKSAASLKNKTEDNHIAAAAAFIVIYALANLCFPAATALTLLAGFLFGTFTAVIYVEIAAVSGALAAFAISRNFAGDWVQHRWQKQLTKFNTEFARRGDMYLVMIRMIPMMPYLLINLVAGLTRIRLSTFAWTTAAGSLPGIIVFSYAGRHILSIESAKQLMTAENIGAFVLLAGFIAAVVAAKMIFFKNNGDC